ncbi:MAG: hypothetical protein ACRC8S_10580 [Fimbriiglobus sp.]
MAWRADPGSTAAPHMTESPAPAELATVTVEAGEVRGETWTVSELLGHVTTQREELRQLRYQVSTEQSAREEKLRHREAQITRTAKAARQERMEARQAMQAYEAQRNREQTQFATEKAASQKALETERSKLHAERQKLEADRAAYLAEDVAARERLQQAWDLVAESQRRLLADRHDVEVMLAQQTQTVAAQETETQARIDHLHEVHATLQTAVAERQYEIQSLETRIEHLRQALEQWQNERPTVSLEPANHSVALVVPGVAHHGETLAFFEEVQTRDHELRVERKRLDRARQELEEKAVALLDQRLVVAEQVAAVAVARKRWQLAEFQTAHELETLAHELQQREVAVLKQEEIIARADEVRLTQAQELWQLRMKLETWQASLTTREAEMRTTLDLSQSETTTRTHQLNEWEARLTEISRSWASIRKDELWQLRQELDQWAAARNRHRLALAEMDELREHLLAEQARVGTEALSQAEAKPVDERTMRVLRKKWERHFRLFRQELSARQAELVRQTTEADDRLRALTESLVEANHAHATRMQEHDEICVDRVRKWRELEERAAALESSDAPHLTTQLTTLKAELDRLSQLLHQTTPPTPEDAYLVPLTVA